MMSIGSVQTVPEVQKVEPAYKQIAEHYRAEIRALRLKPGDQFPSVTEIAEAWDVATSTAGRVLVLLRREGWVVAVHGKATYVAPTYPGATP
jgi:GntR family transcriptional regulator